MEIRKGYFELETGSQTPQSSGELSGVPAAERARVIAATRRVYAEVAAWAKRFPVILPVRIPNTCLTWAATLPEDALPAIGTLSRQSLILFALDDLVDGAIGSYTHEQIERMLDLYRGMVMNGDQASEEAGSLSPSDASPPWAQVARGLAESYGEVSGYPHGVDYYPFIAKHFAMGMDAMSKELEWQRAFLANKFYPTYQEYMGHARSSIMSPALLATQIAVTRSRREASYAKDARIMSCLDQIALAVGTCVRLANDIRSHARELLFENKTSSIAIVMMSRNLTEQEARLHILDEMAACIETLPPLVAALPVELRACGCQAIRHVEIVKEMFLAQEFHHLSKEVSLALAVEERARV